MNVQLQNQILAGCLLGTGLPEHGIYSLIPSKKCFKEKLKTNKHLISLISYKKVSSMIRNRNEEFIH